MNAGNKKYGSAEINREFIVKGIYSSEGQNHNESQKAKTKSKMATNRVAIT